MKTPKDLKPLADAAKAAGQPLTFAMTFPPGTHAMWMRYWLGAGGINPDKDVTLITIPPPQMVANMKVGKMDGFCVGEPWNARAIADGIGFTATTTQQIWKDHPEKVLAFTAEFADKNPRTVQAVMRAVIEAGQYIDKLENRPHVAEVVSRPQYINTQKEVILGRMLGQYDYGDGRKEQDPHYMTFFDRDTNFPWKSHGLWWLTAVPALGHGRCRRRLPRRRRPGEPARPLSRGREGARHRRARRGHQDRDALRRRRLRSGGARALRPGFAVNNIVA